jgi:hypothetical protein
LRYADKRYAKAGNLVDLSSHNANPPCVFDGESFPLSDLADAKIEEGIDAIRRFFAEQRCLPTEERWTAAQMVPSERTIRRRFGSFRSAAAAAGIKSVQITYD